MDDTETNVGASSVRPGLRRTISLPLLIFYGLGTTIGAGIYALLGEVVGRAGPFAPISFLLALTLAGLTGFSFAELSARFPYSAGEAYYVREGFQSRKFASLVGFCVIAAGTVSAAAIVNGFVGYAQLLLPLSEPVWILIIVAFLGAIAIWGIEQSLLVTAIVSAIEIGGIIIVALTGGIALGTGAVEIQPIASLGDGVPFWGILGGCLLAFFAFLGFEDMVNVAEEVRDAERVMPRAIAWTLIVTGALYVAISTVAVLMVAPGELRASSAPLTELYSRAGGVGSDVINLVGIIALINGALVQMIMASRVVYGLADRGGLPSGLSAVNATTRTPIRATMLVTMLIVVLALWFPLAHLAEATSLIALTIFLLVNLALILIKRRTGPAAGVVNLPIWLPVLGSLASAAVLITSGVEKLL